MPQDNAALLQGVLSSPPPPSQWHRSQPAPIPAVAMHRHAATGIGAPHAAPMVTLNYIRPDHQPRHTYAAPTARHSPCQKAFVNSPYTFNGPIEVPYLPPTMEVPQAAFSVNSDVSASSSGTTTPNLSFGSTSGALPTFLPAPDGGPSAAAAPPHTSPPTRPPPQLGKIHACHLWESSSLPPRRFLPPPAPCPPHRGTPPLHPVCSSAEIRSGVVGAAPTVCSIPPPPIAPPPVPAGPAAAAPAVSTPAVPLPCAPAPTTGDETGRASRPPFRAALVGRSCSAPPALRPTPGLWDEGPEPWDPDTVPQSLSHGLLRSHLGTCPHPKPWKKLRAKRGVKFFMCLKCCERWRVPCKYRLLAESSSFSLTPFSEQDAHDAAI
eukprot:EG_transcript_9586